MTMTGKVFSAILGIPVVAVGWVAGVGTANAASLTSPLAALPDPSEISFTSSVILTGQLADDGTLIGTEFDFGNTFSNTPGSIGDLEAEIDIAAGSGVGGFSSFNGVTGGTPDGLIADAIAIGGPAPGVPVVTTPVAPFTFVQLFDDASGTDADDTFFTLTAIDSGPNFTQQGNDVIVDVGVDGFWTSPDGQFDGSLIFTSQFVNQTQAGLIELLQDGAAITPANGVSVTGNAFESPPPIDIPEPTSTMAALLAMGFGAVSLKKRQKQAN